MQNPKQELIGVGLYAIPEAAKLTGVPGNAIRRWLLGYSYRGGGRIRNMPPISMPQFAAFDGVVGLGFLDLMELRFMRAFRHHGVSWREIRLAAERACQIFQHDHPFSQKRFKTDGRRIFAEVGEEVGDAKLIDLGRNQFTFRSVVSPSLYAGLEFSESDELRRWFPMWPRRNVVLDPERTFGRPIVKSVGVPTEILARSADAEEDVARVAKWFDVSTSDVQAAVDFERELRRAA